MQDHKAYAKGRSIVEKQLLRQAAERHPDLILHPYDALMGLQGFDALYTLCENVGGATVYIPSARKMFAECLTKEALGEYNGFNHELLAKKYGYSARHLRRLLQDM